MLVHLLGSFFFTIWSRLEQKPTEQRSQINISRVQSTSWSIFYTVKDCGFHICCITGAELVASWRMHLRGVKGIISFWFHRNSQRSLDSALELYATTPLFIHETSKSQTLIFVAGFGLSHWGIVNRLRVFSDQFLNINIDFFEFFSNERSSMSRSNLKDHMGVNLTHSLPTGLNLQNTNLGSISNWSLPIILWLLDRLHSCFLVIF